MFEYSYKYRQFWHDVSFGWVGSHYRFTQFHWFTKYTHVTKVLAPWDWVMRQECLKFTTFLCLPQPELEVKNRNWKVLLLVIAFLLWAPSLVVEMKQVARSNLARVPGLLLQDCTTTGWKILAPPPFCTKSILLYRHLSSSSNANKNMLIIKPEWEVHENLPCHYFFALKKCC